VNIASIAGISAAPGIGFYGVSKAAHLSLTTQLAFELAPGIRSMRWLPAVIKTRFAEALYEGRATEVAAIYSLARLGAL
jgi:NAD(P)-dependent dehydrogenase (short-subunit alcohol dehydrogenase family)